MCPHLCRPGGHTASYSLNIQDLDVGKGFVFVHRASGGMSILCIRRRLVWEEVMYYSSLPQGWGDVYALQAWQCVLGQVA